MSVPEKSSVSALAPEERFASCATSATGAPSAPASWAERAYVPPPSTTASAETRSWSKSPLPSESMPWSVNASCVTVIRSRWKAESA
jgi:hypothetical protein